MKKKSTECTSDAEFTRWLAKCDADDIVAPYTFALCCDLPAEPAEENLAKAEKRFQAVHQRMYALGYDDEAYAVWYDLYYAKYTLDPPKFVADTIAEHEQNYVPSLVPLSDVKSEAVPWLIEGALARGEITLLGADGGTGKGFVQANIIASVTSCCPCPLLGGDAPEKPGRVLIFPGEDDPSRVLRPRLLAAGADPDRVHVMTPELFYGEKQAVLTLSSEAFRRYAVKTKPDLIIIDPLQSFLPAEVDMARRNEMRAALTPFKAVCAEVGAAGLIVMHTNKKGGVAGRQRLADSSDLWDMARAVFMMGRDPQDKATLYLSNEKNNYAKQLKTALLEIVDKDVEGIRTGAVLLKGLTDKRDADFVLQKMQRAAVTKTAVQEAILDELNTAKTGCVRSETLRARVMEGTGCSKTTYDRAKAELSKSGTIHGRQIRQKDGFNQWFVYRYANTAE